MNITHHFAAGTYAKEALFAPGECFVQHSHPHDHLAILASGTALVGINGEVTEYHAPMCILLKAHIKHAVEAITPITWFCIWSTDDTNPETVDTSILGAP